MCVCERQSGQYQCWVLHNIVGFWSILLVLLGVCINLHGLHGPLRETNQAQRFAEITVRDMIHIIAE